MIAQCDASFADEHFGAQRKSAASRELDAMRFRFPECITKNRELNRPGTAVGQYDVGVIPAMAGRSPLSTSTKGWSSFASAVPRPYEDRDARPAIGW